MLNANMPLILAVAACVILLALIGGSTFIVRRAQYNAKVEKFRQRWHEAQKYCAKPDMWPMAIIEADKLLDDALTLKGFKGKTMGERLVSAQRYLSDNDSVWFGHKLRNKIVHEEIERLYKKDVQNGLKGLRQALQDLGVL